MTVYTPVRCCRRGDEEDFIGALTEHGAPMAATGGLKPDAGTTHLSFDLKQPAQVAGTAGGHDHTLSYANVCRIERTKAFVIPKVWATVFVYRTPSSVT